jgi:hypothetical protein
MNVMIRCAEISDFMQAIASYFLAIWLPVVTGLGCCCHSTACCEVHDEQAADACICECVDHCCGHLCQPGHSHAPAEKGQCKGLCVYMPTHKTAGPARLIAALSFDAALSQPAAVGCGLAVGRTAFDWEAPISEPPVRLHLLNQVILI